MAEALHGGGFFTGCERCGCLSFSQEWQAAFNVMLCVDCKKDEKLISKSVAKATFLLTDKDLSHLGSLSKSNPQKKNWSAMKLYLQSQVEEVARRKHGSAEAIEELRHQKLEQRIDERLAKRKLKGGSSSSSSKLAEQQNRIRQRLDEEYAQQGEGEQGPGKVLPEVEGDVEEF